MVQLHSTGQLPYKSRWGAESAWRFCDAETTLSFSWRDSLGECNKLESPTLRKVTSDWLHSQGSASLGTLGSTSGLYISSSSIGRLRPGLYGHWRDIASSRVCGWSSMGAGKGRSWLSLWSTWRGIKCLYTVYVYMCICLSKWEHLLTISMVGLTRILLPVHSSPIRSRQSATAGSQCSTLGSKKRRQASTEHFSSNSECSMSL